MRTFVHSLYYVSAHMRVQNFEVKKIILTIFLITIFSNNYKQLTMKKGLLSLFALCSVMTAWAQSSPYTGSTVGEGEFYLYNVATGLWIQNIDANNRRADNNWDTGAGMGTAGFDFTLTAVDGGYNLDPKENPRKFGWGYGDGGVMYLDGNIGGNTHWDFTPVEGVSNGYKISIDNHVLGVEVSGSKSFLINNATENDVWQLVTKTERLEKMQTIVSEGNPYDLSFLLGDWNFATNNLRRSQWTEERDGGNDDGFPRGRSWNSCHLVWNTNAYSWTQTITDLPDGLYQLSVQGMYRDGNRNQVGARAANGQTDLIAKYFIGNVEASLMSMLAEAQTTQGDGFETAIENTNPQLYAPDNANNWSIVWALHPDKYWNAPIKVNVRGGSVEVGVRKTSRIDGDWLAMNEFKLEYVGPLDLTEYKNALQAAITAAENYSGNTTTYLANALSAALSTAQSALTSSDIDVIESATEALNTARANAEAADVTFLMATITLAEAEGVDVTSANDVLFNGTTATQVNEVLAALRIARRVANAETHADVFTGNAPAAGDYYLYNVGTGRFFCGGDDWGAHAALGFPGIIVTLEASGENFKIDTHLKNGDALHYLNYGGYCDTQTDETWAFNEVSTGVYNIARSSDSSLLLGYSTSTYNRLDTNKSGVDNPNNQWKLVTKADRDALLATATEAAPQDASYLIKSPGFSQREDVSAWSMTGGAEIWGRGANHPDFAIEAYDKTAAGVEQSVTGLPAGTYELKVQAFYRDGNFATQASILANGGTARQLATLYAGTKSALIQNVSGGADQAPGMGRSSSVGYMPDGIDDACLYFQSGLYWATLDEIVVGQDGTMTIGARKTEKLNAGDWMVLDNFRLIYKGAGIDLTGVKADLAVKITEATNLLNELNLNLSFLETALSNGQYAYANSTDADEIVDATNALQTAINNANAATDITVFKQTVAKAVPEGITDVFTGVVEAVTDGSTFAATVTAQLNAVRTARKMNALAIPDIYTGSAPAVGKFYLFNVGTRMFLGVGSDWNTHAAVDQVGIEIEFVESGDGYNFKCALGSFNASPYVDTGANTVYKFQAVAGQENVYNILQGSDLLGWNPEGKTDGKKYWDNISNVTGADAADANYQWKVITSAERETLLAQASNNNPVDVSYLINNASHNRKFGYDMYTKVAPGGNGGARVSSQDDNNGDRAADFGYEFWNVDNLEWSQQLTGLTPGTYEVAVQGFYRDGDGGPQAGIVNNGGELISRAYLKANDETAQLKNIAYCLDGVPGVATRVTNYGNFPNWPREAFEYFETGYYWISVQVTVGNDGLLKIGVYKDSKVDSDWIVLDNFRLKCLGLTPSTDVTIGAAGYTTFVAPFDISEMPEGVEAYACQVQTNSIHLEPVTAIPAGEAVVLKNAGDYKFYSASSAVELGTDNDLLASDGTVQGGEYIYALANKTDGVGFYPVSSNIYVPAGKGYLDMTGKLVKAFYGFENNATGIETIDHSPLTIDDAIYNVAGQRLNKVQKGINIVNGRKVLK